MEKKIYGTKGSARMKEDNGSGEVPKMKGNKSSSEDEGRQGVTARIEKDGGDSDHSENE